MSWYSALHRRSILGGLAAAALAAPARAQSKAEPGISDGELVLGYTGALTGPLASNGIGIRDGMVAVFNRINDDGGIGGRKLRLMSEDNAYSAPQALSAVRRMMANGGIFTLISTHATPQLAAVLPYMLEQQKVPVFGGFGGLIEWYEPPRPGLFGLYPFGEDQGRALGRWAVADGRRKLLVLHIEGNVYQRSGQAVMAGARDAAVELQGIKFGTSDYAPIAIRISQAKPDAVVVMLSEFETVLLAKELKAQDLETPLYSWVPTVTQSLLASGGASVEGIRATAMIQAPTADTADIRQYRADMAKYFPNAQPEFFSLFGYGTATIYAEALRRVRGPLTHQSLIDAICTLQNIETGIFAPITFTAERHQGTRALFKATVRNGAWVVGDLIDGAPA